MSGYFGTETQQRLQAQAETSVDFINATPGACQNGRMMGCDDPDRLGWELIEEFLERDGVCGFRLIPTGKVDDLRSRLSKRNYTFDTWDVFLADRATALAASEVIQSRELPNGLTDLERPTDPESDCTGRIQALLWAAGIVPFSGSLLAGTLARATTVAVGDDSGNVVAAAHAYLPHNAYSAYHAMPGVGLSPWRSRSGAKG